MKIYTIIIDRAAIWTAKSFALNSKYFFQTPTCVIIKVKMRLLLLKAVLRDVPGLYFLNVLKRLLAVSMTAKTPFQAGVLVLFG